MDTLLHRAVLFVHQFLDAQQTASLPHFTVPGTAPTVGGCASCGDTLSTAWPFRCRLCSQALELALSAVADGRLVAFELGADGELRRRTP